MSVHGFDQPQTMLVILLPLLLAELALVAYCLVDIFRPERRVRGGSKLVWAIVVLLIGTLGPLVYLFWGREDL